MGMPEKPQNGMNIAPDGTVYEVLEDGSIRRIGKVSSNGEFEPFGEQRNSFVVRDSILYRIINGKEQRIGQILPNGDIESINQRIKSEAEISRNKVKIVAILSILIAFLAVIYATQARFQTQAEMKMAETEQRRQEEIQRQEEARRQEEMRRKQAQDEAIRLKEELETEKKKVIAVKEEAAKAEAEAKKAEEERKKQEAKKQAAKAVKKSSGGTRIGNLEWSKRSKNKMNWYDAKQYCANLSEGGSTDWRMPNIDELRMLKDCPAPREDCKSKLGDSMYDIFWSSMSDDGGKTASCENFADYRMWYCETKEDGYVRCVR